MPEMDMSEAFGSEMIDNFDVIRRPQNVNLFGEPITAAPQTFTGVLGIVDEADPNSLQIGEDEQHQGKALSVVTQFKLRGVSKSGGQEFAPDLILWNGDYFKVVKVGDYSRYGFGWIQAICLSQDYVDAPPPNLVTQTVLNNGQ